MLELALALAGPAPSPSTLEQPLTTAITTAAAEQVRSPSSPGQMWVPLQASWQKWVDLGGWPAPIHHHPLAAAAKIQQ